MVDFKILIQIATINLYAGFESRMHFFSAFTKLYGGRPCTVEAVASNSSTPGVMGGAGENLRDRPANL